MPKASNTADELRGASRLVVEATRGVTTLVEEMHRTIGSGPAVLGRPLEGPTRLATGAVYGAIRRITGLVGTSVDVVLEQLSPLLRGGVQGAERDAVLSALNGVIGDHLARTHNPLAIEMAFRRDFAPLNLDDPPALRAACRQGPHGLLVMVHGSCMNDRQWRRNGHDHGAALARDLERVRLDVVYNSGLHVSTNGDAMAELLERLVGAWPDASADVVIVAHSMGGLVARSTCRAGERAGHAWRSRLRSLVFLGTPHHGAPLERGGNWVDTLLSVSRYSAPLARLGMIRSAGVTDLRFGNLVEEDWQGRDRFELGPDLRTPVPLPRGVACYAVAGSRASAAGDGLVPLASALGIHENPDLTLAFPPGHTLTANGASHLDLLDRGDVYAQLLAWLS
ncbi:MAG: alpha/beta hydrolase [Myxococcales bacterium]|nr:alpha/beta hydrolase [Myxococcales bacterium]